MKRLLVAMLGIACVVALTVNVNAQEAKKKHKMSDEQKTLQKEMVEKYDANKDGKLDKEERAKFSAEDKAKWDTAFPHVKGEKKAEKKDDKK